MNTTRTTTTATRKAEAMAPDDLILVTEVYADVADIGLAASFAHFASIGTGYTMTVDELR